MFRPRAEHGQRGEGHPQTDCTLQVSCSYLIVMILQRLCLLSKCLNKCNFAMYSTTTNHYLHTPTYRSHLPTHPSSPVNSSPTYHIEIWTSVSSALCTATNNPQNGETSHAGMKSASLVLTHTHTPHRDQPEPLFKSVPGSSQSTPRQSGGSGQACCHPHYLLHCQQQWVTRQFSVCKYA